MNIALVLSGGTGTRLKAELPKQYIEVAGKPVISYCLETLFRYNEIDAVRIVAEIGWREQIQKWFTGMVGMEKFQGFSNPGINRQMSILNGLEDMKESADDNTFVLVCDAARPMISEKLISECLNAVGGHDGVLPVLPMKDTVYLSSDGKAVSALLDRSKIFAGQAPELFRFIPYYEANQQLLPDRILKINGSTEPAVLAGMDIAMMPGDEDNFKITTRADMDRFCEIVEKRGQNR